MMPTEKEAIVQPKAGALLCGWMTSAMADMAMETLLKAPLITCTRNDPELARAEAKHSRASVTFLVPGVPHTVSATYSQTLLHMGGCCDAANILGQILRLQGQSQSCPHDSLMPEMDHTPDMSP